MNCLQRKLVAVCCGIVMLLLISLAVPDSRAAETAYHFERFAGTPSLAGSSDGSTVSRPRFSSPQGLAVDAAGNIFVADSSNHAIRKISPDGVVTTLAGNGRLGVSDGRGGKAQFNYPEAVALDTDGNVYVAEQGSVRKITPAGDTTTIPASLMRNPDGRYTIHAFDRPAGVAVDRQGVIYVADGWREIIQTISPEGVITTLAGKAGEPGFVDGTGATARFHAPWGLAFDSAGNLFVADSYNHAVRKITPAGEVTTLAGSGSSGFADGVGPDAKFSYPRSVAIDAMGNVLAADSENWRIRKITPGGVVTTVAGVGPGWDPNPPGSIHVLKPQGIAVDRSGNILYSEGYLSEPAIMQLSPDGSSLSRVAGGLVLAGASGGFADGSDEGALFNSLNSAVIDQAGNLFVADRGNHTIREITPAGRVSTFAGQSDVTGTDDGLGAAASFTGPSGLALGPTGDFYVTDGNMIRKISPAGLVATVFGTVDSNTITDGDRATARFYGPSAIAVDRDGTIFIGDNGRLIRKITPDGVTITLAGSPITWGYQDGSGSNAHFGGIPAIVIDPSGDLLVADSSSATIRRVSPTGTVTTFAGIAYSEPIQPVDGPRTTAQFGGVTALARDAAGNLFVGDTSYPFSGYTAVRKIAPNGDVTTLDGPGSYGICLPFGIVPRPDGKLLLVGNEWISEARPNRAPVAIGGAVDTFTNFPVDVVLSADDPDGDVLSYAIVASTHAIASVSENIATITPDPGYAGAGSVRFVASDGFATSEPATITFTVVSSAPTFSQLPLSQSVATGTLLTLSAEALPPAGGPAVSYFWEANGVAWSGDGPDGATYTFYATSAKAGLYDAVAASNGRTHSLPAIVGVVSTQKALGGIEVGTDIVHPNGNIYDQVLLNSYAATVRADPGQVLRISFVDPDDDIVQVEFAGAGNLTLVPDGNLVSGPAKPLKYNQDVSYMKGHFGIVVTGANESTNLSVFSVGRANAINQSLFRDDVDYDGVADITFVAITSVDGKFGGLRTANARYTSSVGFTGVYAPDVTFVGPIYVGNISAGNDATPVLIVKASTDVTQVNGGDLNQPNGRMIQVDGLIRLQFVAGTNSHGVLFPAQANKARFERDGTDVTDQMVGIGNTSD